MLQLKEEGSPGVGGERSWFGNLFMEGSGVELG